MSRASGLDLQEAQKYLCNRDVEHAGCPLRGDHVSSQVDARLQSPLNGMALAH